MSDQFTKEQIESLTASAAVIRPRPIGCTCGKDVEPLPWFHDIGCGFRIEAARQMRTAAGGS